MLSTGILQITNERHEAGMKLRGKHLRTLGVKSDAMPREVDVCQSNAGFTDAASLVECDLERNSHPALRRAARHLPFRESLSNGCNVVIGHLRLFRGLALLDSHPLHRAAGDESAADGLSHDAAEAIEVRPTRCCATDVVSKRA